MSNLYTQYDISIKALDRAVIGALCLSQGWFAAGEALQRRVLRTGWNQLTSDPLNAAITLVTHESPDAQR
jgi:hypothetical protein